MSKIIIGNLKSYLEPTKIIELFSQINASQNLIMAPQSVFLSSLKANFPDFNLAAQDISSITSDYGAYTGEIGANLLKDLSIKYSIIGHSERRQNSLDNRETIGKKIKLAINAGITPIICFGEDLSTRASSKYLEYLSTELENLLTEDLIQSKSDFILAYEPIWSIGTGKIPTIQEIEEIALIMSDKIKLLENKVFLVYGGSVNSKNAKDILQASNIDGVLVGGASTKASELSKILEISNQG